jgi:protein-disulfide isomerase
VREDFLSGIRSGVNGTPTFFVNGVRHNGGYDTESLLEALGVESRALAAAHR